MNMKNVVIIIPTYNESLVIEETIHQVFKATSSAAMSFHVLVFDSSSTDNTQNIVSHLQKQYPQLHVITEPQKTGLGSAYLQAMHYALAHLGADIIVEFDADLSHQPCYLLPMIEKMHDHDVVVGSRYIKGGSIPRNWGWHRKLLSKLGNIVARIALTPKYKDFTSGFRATHYLALNKALPKRFISNNYAYKLELLWALHKTKAKIAEYPIEFVDREKGQSKLPANSIFDSLRVLATLRLNELKPYFSMCAVGLIGLVIQCLVYNVLRLNFPPFFAVQLAVVAAMVNNFILNNKFTFKKRSLSQRFKSFAFFVGYSVLMVGFQGNWVKLGINYFGTGYLKENLVMVSGVILGSVLNYLFYSRLVWREKRQQAILQ
ncbi:glycosyl transferase [Legionella antarctica]|uniref:Glycosyl transferase n=1 Tax=Legionella antarctica TaxID=2708020 RepID=A0A6F8TAM0_9GAMM|nr:glycosyltransferase family 2 protein [Legionella antarctica]BCA97112.1 glycosyl transferase [Legionella antarctica]